jgi:glycerophosphoryl diester phosphodiesterase
MNYRKILMLSLTALTLSACGGGGGGHGSSSNPPYEGPPNLLPVGQPIVISHRGASGYLPEHTLAAYELAIRMNVDYIEPDLQFTSDGHLVAMHDDTLDRTTNVASLFAKRNDHTDYPVSDFTLAEVKTLTVVPPAGGTSKTTYPGFTPSMADPFKIPTFEEVIEFAKAQSVKYNRQIGIYPEAKQADPLMEDGILATLKAYGMDKAGSPVFIQSFSDETILNIHEKQKAQGTNLPLIVLGVAFNEGNVAKMGITGGAGIKAVELSEIAKFAAGVGVLIGMKNYGPYDVEVTRSFIEQAHAAGLKVHGWTFSKADAIAAQKEYREYLDIGMDGMFSNYPDLAILARDQFNVAHKFVKDDEGPQITSHRGASGYLPEHTFAAYELAIRMGVDYIEPDLQFTSDGVLVAMHDDTLDQNTNVASLFATRNGHSNYPVSDFSLAEIRTMAVTYSDAGTAETSYPGFTPSTPNADQFGIPTFEEVIDFAKAQSAKYGRPIGIYPEAKQADPLMENDILSILAAKGLPSADVPVLIQSFSGDTIKSLHDKQVAQGTNIPQILLGYAVMDNGVAKLRLSGNTALPKESIPNVNGTTSTATNVVSLSTAKSIANGISVTITNATYPVTKEFIDQAHAAGLKVHSWTYSRADAILAAEEYYKFFAMGMDGMFSNYPNLAVMARDWFLQSSN